jgi:hypothetical protein
MGSSRSAASAQLAGTDLVSQRIDQDLQSSGHCLEQQIGMHDATRLLDDQSGPLPHNPSDWPHRRVDRLQRHRVPAESPSITRRSRHAAERARQDSAPHRREPANSRGWSCRSPAELGRVRMLRLPMSGSKWPPHSSGPRRCEAWSFSPTLGVLRPPYETLPRFGNSWLAIWWDMGSVAKRFRTQTGSAAARGWPRAGGQEPGQASGYAGRDEPYDQTQPIRPPPKFARG